jgi:hypothetical protein
MTQFQDRWHHSGRRSIRPGGSVNSAMIHTLGFPDVLKTTVGAYRSLTRSEQEGNLSTARAMESFRSVTCS